MAIVRELECPQCGDVGAEADKDGYFWDGARITCGCRGWVSMCSETEPHIVLDDEQEPSE